MVGLGVLDWFIGVPCEVASGEGVACGESFRAQEVEDVKEDQGCALCDRYALLNQAASDQQCCPFQARVGSLCLLLVSNLLQWKTRMQKLTSRQPAWLGSGVERAGWCWSTQCADTAGSRDLLKHGVHVDELGGLRHRLVGVPVLVKLVQ